MQNDENRFRDTVSGKEGTIKQILIQCRRIEKKIILGCGGITAEVCRRAESL